MKFVLLLAAVVCSTLAIVIPRSQDSVLECTMCEIAVRAADPSLEKDATTVEKDFINDCEKVIPGKIGQLECTKYAHKELDGIIKELNSGTAPEDVCTKLHTC